MYADAEEVTLAVGLVTSVALMSGLKAPAILVQSAAEGTELTGLPLESLLNHNSRTNVSGVVPELVRLKLAEPIHVPDPTRGVLVAFVRSE